MFLGSIRADRRASVVPLLNDFSPDEDSLMISRRRFLAFFWEDCSRVHSLQRSPGIGLMTDDGLPQNAVNAILQTRDGYLWLATFDGLVRFDGLEFTVFS